MHCFTCGGFAMCQHSVLLIFRGCAICVGSGDIHPGSIRHSKHMSQQMILSVLKMGMLIICTAITIKLTQKHMQMKANRLIYEDTNGEEEQVPGFFSVMMRVLDEPGSWQQDST